MIIQDNKIYIIEERTLKKKFFGGIGEILTHWEYLAVTQFQYGNGNRMPLTEILFFRCDKDGKTEEDLVCDIEENLVCPGPSIFLPASVAANVRIGVWFEERFEKNTLHQAKIREI